MSKISLWKSAALLFCSGFCALVYQVVWLRELRLVFGSSTVANGVVLAIFMGGLGFGAVFFGRLADRNQRPLALYGYLEMGVALGSILSPFLIILVRKLYIYLGGEAALGVVSAVGLRLLLSAMVLGVPAVLMGGSLPAMVRAVENDVDQGRRDLGVLYGFNALGGVVGVILPTFIFLELIGNRLTIWTGCALNVVIAVTALYLARGLTISVDSAVILEGGSSIKNGKVRVSFIYIAALVSGFVFFLMELVWYRLLAPLLGGSTYTFGLVLALVLFGIGIGGMAFSIRNREQRSTMYGFSLVCSLQAFFIAMPFALGDRVALIAALLKPFSLAGLQGHIFAWTMVAGLVVLPAAVLSGIQFPMLIGLLGEARRQVGRHTGNVYLCNTVGAICGSLVGGFVLIPWFGAPDCWQMATLLMLLLAIVAAFLPIFYDRKKPCSAVFIPIAIVAASVLMIFADGPSATWRHSAIGIGRHADFKGRDGNELQEWAEKFRREIIWEQEGRESSVAIHAYDGLSFIINGKADGHSTVDAGTQVMGPLVGAILHPRPRRGLVIGLGTGSSAGWLAEIPSITQVDVVELEPAVTEVAERCGPVNFDVMSHPKVRVTFGDAREVVQTVRASYDVVFSEPSDPYRAGIASLYSREFYESVAMRLNPGGIFSQWLQTYYVDAQTVRTILTTLASVFGDVEIWITDDTNLLFVCSQEPKQYSVAALRQKVASEPFRSGLRNGWGVEGLEGFLAGFVAKNEVARKVLLNDDPSARLNTDDNLLAEFGFARTAGRLGLFSVKSFRQEVRSMDLHRPVVQDGMVDWSWVDENFFRMLLWFGGREVAVDQSEKTPMQLQRAGVIQRFTDGDFSSILSVWQTGVLQDSFLELAATGEALAETGDARATDIAAELANYWPASAGVIMARYFWRIREKERAVAELVKALKGFHSSPWQVKPLMIHGLQLAIGMAYDTSHAVEIYDLLREPFSVYNLEEYRKFCLLQVGKAIDADHSAMAIAQWEPHIPWQEGILRDRLQAYQSTGSPLASKANFDLQKFLDNKPSSFWGRRNNEQ